MEANEAALAVGRVLPIGDISHGGWRNCPPAPTTSARSRLAHLGRQTEFLAGRTLPGVEALAEKPATELATMESVRPLSK